jgi:hypothetical protein
VYEQLLNTWVPNQKVTVGRVEEGQIYIMLNQSTSTPGIKTNIKLDPGNYLLSFDIIRSDEIKCSIFCFSQATTEAKSIQIPINENTIGSLVCGSFKINQSGTYTLYVLATNPQENKMLLIDKINLKKIQLTTLTNKTDYCGISHPTLSNISFYKKITYGSISCAGEVAKLHATFGGLILTKEQILKKTWIKDKSLEFASSDKFVLLGLYSPHHWANLYKPLFDKFSRVMIIFTGTDITQLSGNKISPELKQTICDELAKPKYILGALNQRNLDEIKQSHGLDCKIISLPLGLGLNLSAQQIQTNTSPIKSIACYFGENLEWYCHSTLVQVAKVLPDYKFYFYKYGGFTQDFISNPKNSSLNIIYNTQTIDNFFEFMQDKFCSVRITLHDGEPMSGIETICMSKPFVFNHEMKYSIQTTNQVEQIAQTIINTYAQVSQGLYDPTAGVKYYLDRNSNRTFEKNLFGWFGLNLSPVKILEKTKILTIPSNKVNTSEHIWEYTTHELGPGLYNIQFNGSTTGYACLFIKPNSKVFIESTKYSQINQYESLSFIEFKLGEKTQVTLGLKMGYPQLNEYIQIRSFGLYH